MFLLLRLVDETRLEIRIRGYVSKNYAWHTVHRESLKHPPFAPFELILGGLRDVTLAKSSQLPTAMNENFKKSTLVGGRCPFRLCLSRPILIVQLKED